MNKSIVVTISCITYNHAKYLKKCLDSFLMQKTDFCIEILVHDDASTDGTIDIIKEYAAEYPDLIKPYYQKENQYSKGRGFIGSTINFNRARGKYIACCEGDDYWTDPLKLQKQVDYMESHPNCSLCTHAHYDDREGILTESHRYDHNVDDCALEDIIMIGGGFVATNSMLFKTSSVKQEYPDWYKNSPVGDLVRMYWLATQGKVAYLNDVMSAYRIAAEGSWTQRMAKSWKKRNKFFNKDIEIHEDFDRWSAGTYHTAIERKVAIIKQLKRSENVSHIKAMIKRILHVK